MKKPFLLFIFFYLICDSLYSQVEIFQDSTPYNFRLKNLKTGLVSSDTFWRLEKYQYYFLGYKTKKVYLLDRFGKEILFAYTSIEAQGFSKNLIWVNNHHDGTDMYQGWIPFDTLGKRISANSFDKVFFVQHKPLIVDWVYKKGVVDANFNWVIAPEYSKITELNIQNYLVLNDNEHYGLLSSKNEIIVDTIYKNASEIYRSHTRTGKLESWWLFENEADRVLVENISLEKITNSFKIDSLIQKFVLQSIHNESETAYKLEYSGEYKTRLVYDSILNQAPYKKSFITFMLNIFEQHKDKLCFYSEPAYGYDVKVKYSVLACGNNFISIKINYNKERFSQVRLGNRELSEENYMMIWQNGELSLLGIEDIFDEEELNKELKIALQLYNEYHESKFPNETSPIDRQYGGIDYLIEEEKMFHLEKEGLVVFLGKNDYSHYIINAIIPKERLLMYKKNEWIIDCLK